MRVLVACEYSGRVRQAFRAQGHNAWSCDLLPAEDRSPYHYQCDVFTAMYAWGECPWDLMVAHPPCTHLAVSGSRWFPEKVASGEQQEAIDFFLALARAPISRIAIENPVCIMSSVWREPDQIIQPWQFGHKEMKSTCLWLKGLPPLMPTKVVGPPPSAGTEERKAWERVWRMPPKGWNGDSTRWKERSRTYEGIAQAMAQQCGNYTDLVTQMEAA